MQEIEKDYVDHLDEIDPESGRLADSLGVIRDLIDRRVQLGMSQADVAKAMGIPRPRVTELEAKPESVSFDRIAHYAAVLGATLIAKVPTTRKAKVAIVARGRPVGSSRLARAQKASKSVSG